MFMQIYQQMILLNMIFFLIIFMLRQRIILSKLFCGAKIIIPEVEQGNKLCLQGKFVSALNSYSRAVEIMNSAKLNEQPNADYLEAVAKLAATQYLTQKYKSSIKTLDFAKGAATHEDFMNYFTFLDYTNQHVLGTFQELEQKLEGLNDIKALVQKLLSKKSKQKVQSSKFPILSSISRNLNNSQDYQKLLVGLIERSPKSPKADEPIPQISQLEQKQMNEELLLLSSMGILLQNKILTTADKEKLNGLANDILKRYQQSRQKEVYKPLLVIIMSLIGEKHYMSAQGMIGFVKTEQQTLINSYKSQDKNLINNIYRMLVTRANNEKFEVGWAKEEPILLGNLVVERIIKAPLFGHSIKNMIC